MEPEEFSWFGQPVLIFCILEYPHGSVFGFEFPPLFLIVVWIDVRWTQPIEDGCFFARYTKFSRTNMSVERPYIIETFSLHQILPEPGPQCSGADALKSLAKKTLGVYSCSFCSTKFRIPACLWILSIY